MSSLKKISTFFDNLFQMMNVSIRAYEERVAIPIPIYSRLHSSSWQLGTSRNDTIFKSNSFLNFAIPKNAKCKNSNEAGYTFLEFVIVIVLIGIIAGVMSTMFVFGVDMFNSSVSRKDTVPGSRIAAEFLINDFRAIADASDIASAATTNLQFNNIDSETITYSYSGGSLSRNSNTLLDGLSDFQFTFLDVDGDTLSSPVTTPSNIWKISFSLDATVDGNPFHLASGVVPRKF